VRKWRFFCVGEFRVVLEVILFEELAGESSSNQLVSVCCEGIVALTVFDLKGGFF
jgi:hypothetical protein